MLGRLAISLASEIKPWQARHWAHGHLARAKNCNFITFVEKYRTRHLLEPDISTIACPRSGETETIQIYGHFCHIFIEKHFVVSKLEPSLARAGPRRYVPSRRCKSCVCGQKLASLLATVSTVGGADLLVCEVTAPLALMSAIYYQIMRECLEVDWSRYQAT